jgi:hypothetical protein
MALPPLIVLFGSSLTTVTTTAVATTSTAYLHGLYSDACTNFNHTPGSATFTGNVRFSGNAVVIFGGTSTSTHTATPPPLTFTMGSASFDTVGGSSVAFSMTMSSFGVTNFPGYTLNGANPLINGYLLANGTLFGTTSIVCGAAMYVLDVCFGTILPGNSFVIEVTRGGSCPV